MKNPFRCSTPPALFADLIAFASTLLLVVVMGMAYTPAHAQEAPRVTLSCTPSSGVESVTPTCVWSTVGVKSCKGSGAWSGDKAIEGNETLAAIDRSGSFVLVCRTPTGGAVVSWTAPTQNTNGTPLTNLAGFKIYYGPTADALFQSVTINNPATRSYTIENLPEGTQVFAATAVTTDGVESALSNKGSKNITASDVTGKSDVEVKTRPKAITVTVQ